MFVSGCSPVPGLEALRMRELYMSSCAATDSCMVEVCRIQTLTKIDISHNDNITNAGTNTGPGYFLLPANKRRGVNYFSLIFFRVSLLISEFRRPLFV